MHSGMGSMGGNNSGPGQNLGSLRQGPPANWGLGGWGMTGAGGGPHSGGQGMGLPGLSGVCVFVCDMLCVCVRARVHTHLNAVAKFGKS